jgi:DNA-directed RNA polymerase subunit M/transcription elongation factor TFIIS
MMQFCLPARAAAAQSIQRASRNIRSNIRTREISIMAKIAKTGDRKKVMDTNKSTDCPKCSKPTRIVKRVKDRERGTPGGVYISCSACDFFEKL